MQKHKPSPDDPSSQWPEEIKKAYEHLTVPSLYDCIEANEKLSLEIRRQNKEIKQIGEQLQTIGTQLNNLMSLISEIIMEVEEYEEYEDDEDFEEEEHLSQLEYALLRESQEEIQKGTQTVLMDITDSLVDLSKVTRQLGRQLHQQLTHYEQQQSKLNPSSHEMVDNVTDSVDKILYQLVAKLEGWHIEVIEPKPGDPFNSEQHRVLEHIKGGKSGTIARVVRVGYMQDDQVLRFADVVVYQ